MVSPEHERSSSSPSVKIQSLSKRRSRRPGEEIEVVLSDASSFFVSMRVWEEAPFHEGDRLNLQRWDEILRRTNHIRARGQALSLLARSEHSRFLLRQKLLQRSHDIGIVETVLDALEAEGSLSDRRYAHSWVRSRLRAHPEGRAHLVAGLRSRGVDGTLAEQAVSQVLEEESVSMVDSARRLVERLTRRKSMPAEKLAERLYRRGFSAAVVREAVEEVGSDTDGDGDGDGDQPADGP